MTSQEKYSAMSYEKLADYVVLGGPDAPFEGIMELIHRGPSQADYLLRYVQDDSYWFSDSFEDRMVPVIAIGILACLKRRDLFEEISDYMSESYDFLIDVFDPFTLSILSDLLPLDISRVETYLDSESIHKFLLSDIIEAYGLMTGRGIIARSTLVEFLKEGIQNRNNTQLTTMCIWVSLDVGANELKPFIDNAFRENRVDLDVITQDDIIFHSGKSGMHSYLDPVQFFEPSNFDKIKESIDHEAEASDIIYDIYHNTGPNDPCPCNSGKKFKKCCRPLLVEREKYTDLEGRVWKHLDECKYSDAFRPYIEKAYNVFRNEVSAEITNTNDMFLVWAIHDFLVPSQNRSLISLYIENHSSSIRKAERDVLKDIQHSNFVIVEVEKVVPYVGYHVAEIFPGKEHYFITDTLSTKQVSNHSLLLLKLYGIRTLNRIAGGVLKIPYNEIGFVQDLSKDLINKYTSTIPPANRNKLSLSTFIARNSLSLISAIYERSRRRLFPQVLSTEGDPVEFHSSTYRIDDMSYVMSKLSQDIRFDFDPGSGNTFVWKGPIDDERTRDIKTDIGIRVYGTIRLVDDSITVECFTQNRWMKCVTVLRSLLGDKMGPEIIRSETGIADAIRDQHLTGDEHDEKKSPEMKRIEQDLINAYYMKWMDMKIPALDGKTPREAVKDPHLKKQLISLLNDMESKTSPLAIGPKPPIEIIKRELGL